MTDKFIFSFIESKQKENSEFIKYSYYELKIKYNLTNEEIDQVLKVSRDYFENKNYKVYFTNARYEYNGASQNVQPNELLIAFKE